MTELDHVALRTTEFDRTKAFFEDIFEMRCYRESGEAPHRIIFYLEGLQLNEVTEVQSGENVFDHISIGVADVAATMKKVGEKYPDCRLEKDHWVVLPDGQTRIELKPYHHALAEYEEYKRRQQ